MIPTNKIIQDKKANKRNSQRGLVLGAACRRRSSGFREDSVDEEKEKLGSTVTVDKKKRG